MASTGGGTANHNRAVRAATRHAAIARQLLTIGGWDKRQRTIAAVRRDVPDWTWAEIGSAIGLTKDQAVAAFRRMAVRAGLR